MKCSEIGCGTYDCTYNIMPPFKTGFSHEFKNVAVDKCLVYEVIQLWELGIKTTGCCCGHGRLNPYIGVYSEYIEKMKSMGYKVQYNSCRPGDEDTFYPKTNIKYGEISKGFNWWEENMGYKKEFIQKLKPCPFCGGKAEFVRNRIMIQGKSERYAWVYCKKCGSKTKYTIKSKIEHYMAKAIESWDRRTPNDKS